MAGCSVLMRTRPHRVDQQTDDKGRQSDTRKVVSAHISSLMRSDLPICHQRPDNCQDAAYGEGDEPGEGGSSEIVSSSFKDSREIVACRLARCLSVGLNEGFSCLKLVGDLIIVSTELVEFLSNNSGFTNRAIRTSGVCYLAPRLCRHGKRARVIPEPLGDIIDSLNQLSLGIRWLRELV